MNDAPPAGGSRLSGAPPTGGSRLSGAPSTGGSRLSGAPSTRIAGLLALAGTGVIAGLASGHPELAVLAAPFLVLVGVGLALVRRPQLAATIELRRERVLEGEGTQVRVELRNDGETGAELELELARAGALAVDPDGSTVVRLARGDSATLEFTVVAQRWGAHAVGPLLVQARDPLGMTTWTGRLGDRVALKAFPHEQRLRALIMTTRTQPFVGTHVARARREGIEFADIRAFAPGDRVRQINWRATARRGSLYVTERHPEHSSDVVLLLDTFAEARGDAGGTLDSSVRAIASLARSYLERRDRVGLVDFGGTLHWLTPAFGTTQLYRVIDALLSSEIAFSYALRAVDSLPRRVLPPGALIVAITPLLDNRSVRLITDLHRRGADLAVIEVSPLPHFPPATKPSEQLPRRLWQLEREVLRGRLRSLGIGLTVWDGGDMLGPELEEVNAFRRSTRHSVRA